VGARSERVAAAILVAAVGLAGCGGDDGDDGALDLDAVEAYAERLSDEVADTGGDLASWIQDPDRDGDDLESLAEGLREAESDDGDLPSTGELAGTSFDVQGGTVSGDEVADQLGQARSSTTELADELDRVAGLGGDVDVPTIVELNEAYASASEATAALREVLAGAGP
jgi:hypothetical protein